MSSSELEAKFYLAEAHLLGRNDTPQDVKEAFRLYQQCAENGHGRSMVAVATLNLDGVGTELNQIEWMIWIQKAADKGDSLGEAFCSFFEYGGRGHDRDKIYQLALPEAEAGDVRAMYVVALSLGNDHEKAFHWYKMAADQHQGYYKAMPLVGTYYMNGNGLGGVEKNFLEAARYYHMYYEVTGLLYKVNPQPCLIEICRMDKSLGAEWIWKFVSIAASKAEWHLERMSTLYWSLEHTLPPLRHLAARAVIEKVENGMDIVNETYDYGISNEVDLVRRSLLKEKIVDERSKCLIQ